MYELLALLIAFATMLYFFAKKLNQPPLLAYVVAGMLVGMVFHISDNIGFWAELGVALLLFTTGLEMDWVKLKKAGKMGFFSTIVTTIVFFPICALLSIFLHFSLQEMILMWIVVSLSSTMVVASLLVDRKIVHTMEGRLLLSILLFQDILAVFFLSVASEFLTSLIKLIVLVLFSFALSMFFRKYSKKIAKHENLLQMFALSSIFMFMSLSHIFDLSIAIGAFLAGIALAVEPFNLDIIGWMRPLREFFSILFFASLGLQLTPSFSPILMLILLILIVIVKPIIFYLSLRSQRIGETVARNTAFYLAQSSEFSLIIALHSMMLGLISKEMYNTIIFVTVISISITPYLTRYLFVASEKTRKIDKENHIVLIGCHRTGRKILKYLDKKKVVVVDYDPEVIEKVRGVTKVYGNALNDELLENINIGKAKLVIITIPDDKAAMLLIRKIRKRTKSAFVIARASSRENAAKMKKYGANYVIIPEEAAGILLAQIVRGMGI